ncbi:MAG: helix-turn-helix domain-containing protein [Rhodobacteraceae bacterium]|nr:helix-turn-helix domain-containing protein [Paracoccaceae bacterium]
MVQIPDTPARLRIVPISRLTAGPRWQLEAMRSLREPCLLWFTQGQGRITISGATRGFHAHNAIFIPAGVMHGLTVTHRAQGSMVLFGRDCRLDLPETQQHLRLREKVPQSELTGIIENIQRELDSRRPGAETAAHHHLGLLAVWLARQIAERAGDGPTATPRAAEKLAARYAVLLEREFHSGFGVADYAAALGVTPTHLTRVCKACSGRTALDLLQDRRLFEARRLLRDTALPVKDIAAALGFSTPSYFTRSFQHSTGQTPSAFRRNR